MQNILVEQLNEFLASDKKHSLIIGNEHHRKHIKIIKYLNSMGKKLRILIRINSMARSEDLLGFKAKTGKPHRMGNLTIYVDSMQLKSHTNTPTKFNYIIVYPIESLKGVDDNNIGNILNDLSSQKVFWISCHSTRNNTYIKEVCEINSVIEVNKEGVVEESIKESTDKSNFDYLIVKDLSYYRIEEALSSKYNMGFIQSSSMGQELEAGGFGKYTFMGASKTKTFIIKVKDSKFEENYVLLVKECSKN